MFEKILKNVFKVLAFQLYTRKIPKFLYFEKFEILKVLALSLYFLKNSKFFPVACFPLFVIFKERFKIDFLCTYFLLFSSERFFVAY